MSRAYLWCMQVTIGKVKRRFGTFVFKNHAMRSENSFKERQRTEVNY